MDHAVVVEGNILLDDEDDESSVSSEESEQDVGSSSANYVSSSRRTYDDDEEEIEVFTEGNSSANTVSKQAPASKPSPVKENKLAAAIPSSTGADSSQVELSSTSEDEFGVRYESRHYPAWFDKHNPVAVNAPASVVYATEIPTDSVKADDATNSNTAAEDEDDEFAVVGSAPDPSVLQALENIKRASHDAEDVNFDKELSEYAHNYSANAKSQALDEKALNNNKLYTNTFNIFAGDRINTQGSMLSDEPLVILDSQPMDHLLPDDLPQKTIDRSKVNEDALNSKAFMQESKKALAEIVDIYAQGMGDQEVLLLDLMKEDENEQGKLSLKKNKGGKENDIRATEKIYIDKTLNVITEGDEEEEEDDEEEDEREIVIRQPGQRKTQNQKPAEPRSELEEEWNAVVLDQNNPSKNNATAATNLKAQQGRTNDVPFEDSNKDYQKWTYEALLSHLNSLDLSSHEPHIVVSEKNPAQSKGFLKSMFSGSSSSSSTALQFPNAENSLKFPFLLAQVDYDPFDIKHLNLLRTIYYALLEGSSSDIVSPIDEKWENLGFQGKDPRTDLNRAIKLLSLVQVLAFLESNRSLVKYLFEISESAQSVELQTNKKVSRSSKEIDYSWPFMCVSILISKEAIQCLRYGELVELCNRKKNVLEALNLFHHACFAEFGRLLIEDPSKHHAMHLATLREKCAKNPGKILKAYNDNNDLIINSILSNDYYSKLQKQVSKPSNSTTKNTNVPIMSKGKEEVIESFDKFEEIDDDPSYFNREAEKEISKSKNAKKFMVRDDA